MANIKREFKYYYIYKIVNLINKKHYVGFHATDKEYEKDNYFGSSRTLKKAIKKYGIENFIKEIIEYVNEDNWKEREMYWITEMHSHTSEWGYNLTKGGDGTLGLKMREESRENIRKSRIGKTLSTEARLKISKKIKGRKFTEEHKKRISISNTGKKCSEETKQRVSKANKGNKYRVGKYHTEETKSLIREKSKISSAGEKNAMFGHVYTKETLLKLKKSANTILICPHCKKEIKRGTYNRWHGNNCKLKPKPN